MQCRKSTSTAVYFVHIDKQEMTTTTSRVKHTEDNLRLAVVPLLRGLRSVEGGVELDTDTSVVLLLLPVSPRSEELVHVVALVELCCWRWCCFLPFCGPRWWSSSAVLFFLVVPLPAVRSVACEEVDVAVVLVEFPRISWVTKCSFLQLPWLLTFFSYSAQGEKAQEHDHDEQRDYFYDARVHHPN